MKSKKQDIKERKNRMAKQIVLKDALGNKYTLEFNREITSRMQRNGFVMDTDRLQMLTEDLVTGAFKMHHKKLDWDKIEPIWLAQNHRNELLKVLAEMYMEPTVTLMGTDEEDPEANPTWEVVE